MGSFYCLGLEFFSLVGFGLIVIVLFVFVVCFGLCNPNWPGAHYVY